MRAGLFQETEQNEYVMIHCIKLILPDSKTIQKKKLTLLIVTDTKSLTKYYDKGT